MHPMLRRMRGVLGTALVWGGGWGALGFLAGVPQWTVVGFGAGAGFAVALALAERRRRAEALAFRRMALWGALGAVAGGSVAVPWLSAMSGGELRLLPFLGLSALLGAGSAAGTLLAVRRAGAPTRPTVGDARREGTTLDMGGHGAMLGGGGTGAPAARDASRDAIVEPRRE